MLYRILASITLIAILGGLAFFLEGGSSPSTSVSAPASAGPDDAAMKSLKIE
jgi:hypothetical protein